MPFVYLPVSQGDPCAELQRAIIEARNVLVGRAVDIVANRVPLPMYGPKDTVESHQQQFQGWQRHEQKLLKKWGEYGCKGQLPKDAWEWAYKPVPVPRVAPSRQTYFSETPVPAFQPAPQLAGRDILVIIGIGIIVFDVLTIPSGEGLAGIPLIAQGAAR